MPPSTRLLTNAAIAAAIKKAIDARAERTGITTDRVLTDSTSWPSRASATPAEPVNRPSRTL